MTSTRWSERIERKQAVHQLPSRPACFSSSSAFSTLPPLDVLRTWVHRPQAVAKCCISDIYQMHAVVEEALAAAPYAPRDVFLLNQFPCRMVEVVAWVAGVDHKETSMTVTLDDGDGRHVLPVTIRLPLVTAAPSALPVRKIDTQSSMTDRFLTAKERKAMKRAIETEHTAAQSRKSSLRVYVRSDVRVGDTVRIVGKVDEWMRRKVFGESEWVRQVVVDEGNGGSIVVVDPDEQFFHVERIARLHRELYSKHFEMPSAILLPVSTLPTSPMRESLWSEGMEPSSEIGSVVLEDEELRLRDPARLRSSQLTDKTFRHYLLDHMAQETLRLLRSAEDAGPSAVQSTLNFLFPEYPSMTAKKGKARVKDVEKTVFRPSRRVNSQESDTESQATPTVKTFRARSARQAISQTQSSTCHIRPFTLRSLLVVPHLRELAQLVVDAQAKKEERHRRRRIQDGMARPQDLEVESRRRRIGKAPTDWKLGEEERLLKMDRLVEWVIRNVAEEGSLVQVRSPVPTSWDEYLPRLSWGSSTAKKRAKTLGEGEEAYLPLPSQLFFLLLKPHFAAERTSRSEVFIAKRDPRWGNGLTIGELAVRLRGWGEDGRWERVGEWKVREAVDWGMERGMLRKEGAGWWLTEE